MERTVDGIDGSDSAHRALAWAVAEARLRQAQLDVVHAWQMPNAGGAYAMAYAPQPFEDAARSTLDEAIKSQDLNGLPVEVRPLLILAGAATAILQAAEGADLIVVGSRGLGGFKELLLGSVSHQIVHHARCAVLIVPAG